MTTTKTANNTEKLFHTTVADVVPAWFCQPLSKTLTIRHLRQQLIVQVGQATFTTTDDDEGIYTVSKKKRGHSIFGITLTKLDTVS